MNDVTLLYASISMSSSKESLSKQKLRRAKNAVRGALNVPSAPYLELMQRFGKARLSPTDLILGGLANLEANEAEGFLAWVNAVASRKLQVYPAEPVLEYRNLQLAKVKAEVPLVSRLYWLAIFLEGSKEKLATFVDLSTKLEGYILAWETERAFAVIEDLSQQFGLSIWLIQTRLALLQKATGLDAQKEYAQSIKTAARGRVAGVIASWASQRNEDNTVFGRFKVRLESAVKDWKTDQSIKDAYVYLLGGSGFDGLTESRASAVVGSLSALSLVDAYVAVVEALQLLLTKPQEPAVLEKVVSIASRLPSNDFRVAKIAALASNDLSNLNAVQLSPPAVWTEAFVDKTFDANSIISAAIDLVEGHAALDAPNPMLLKDLYGVATNSNTAN